jgi:hypothetical protein
MSKENFQKAEGTLGSRGPLLSYVLKSGTRLTNSKWTWRASTFIPFEFFYFLPSSSLLDVLQRAHSYDTCAAVHEGMTYL